jgi:phosphomannomutase
MEIKTSIFKAYDIRGIYPSELNSKTAELIGEATARFLSRKSKKKRIKIVLARDSRASSPLLARAVKEGILRQGSSVVEVGMVPTPSFYFAVWRYNFEGGIMVTASHNPPRYNGLKIVKKDAEVIGKESGLENIKMIALKEAAAKGRAPLRPGGRGKRVIKREILGEYLELNLKELKNKKSSLKVVIDTGNAVSGRLIALLKKKVGFKIYHLFPKIDSSFPNHLPNPLELENLKSLQRAVRAKRADFGVAFDGDGDRIVFVDEKGKVVPSDFITCLIAENLLKKNKGARVIYNLCSSNIIREVVEENGGKAIAWKVGHTFVKQKMKEEKALFAGEFSGHFYFKSHHYSEAPLLVLFSLIDELVERGKPFSELLRPLKRYYHSGQINIRVKDKEKKLRLLKERFKKGKISLLDGLRVDFPDWWFCARPSNTEDLLRVSVESKSKKTLREKVKLVVGLIKG